MPFIISLTTIPLTSAAPSSPFCVIPRAPREKISVQISSRISICADSSLTSLNAPSDRVVK